MLNSLKRIARTCISTQKQCLLRLEMEADDILPQKEVGHLNELPLHFTSCSHFYSHHFSFYNAPNALVMNKYYNYDQFQAQPY